MKVRSFRESLYKRLENPEFAAAYLDDALRESFEEFLVAVGHVVKARGGFTKMAEETKLSREAAYRMLSETGNPELRSIQKILESTGLRFTVGVLGDVRADEVEDGDLDPPSKMALPDSRAIVIG